MLAPGFIHRWLPLAEYPTSRSLLAAGKAIFLKDDFVPLPAFPGGKAEWRGGVHDRRLQPTIGAGIKEHCMLARNWAASLRGKALDRIGNRSGREASSAKNPRIKERHLAEVLPNRKPARREQHDCHARRRLADDAAIAQRVRRLGGIDAAARVINGIDLTKVARFPG
jgi:hypothetical protein